MKTFSAVAPLVLAAVLAPAPAAAQFGFFNTDSARIVATGYASVPVRPTGAEVYLSVVGRAPEPGGALTAVQAARDAILQALATQGITARDVAPWGVALGREVAMGGRPPGLEGPEPDAEGRVGVRVTLRELERLDEVLLALTDAGVERVAYVAFRSEDGADEEARREAVRRAVVQARVQAEAMAEAAGVRLGALDSMTSTPLLDTQFTSGFERTMTGGPYDRGAVLVPADVSVRVSVTAAWRIAR